MPDYSKGLIYTIRTCDNLYVGSTTNFTKRKYRHKCKIKNSDGKLYQTIRDNECRWEMKPYKEFPCENKIQLTIEEERIRRELNADLNMVVCGTGINELSRKEYKKKYREENKEQISKKKKEYYEANKEEILKKEKEYYEANAEEIKEKKREKITCECGCIVSYRHLSQHKKTKKHLKLLDAKNPIP
jgi:post-segregation antitoxin (ccd killing protein)